MSNEYKNIREQSFASEWLAWAALRHFLPAPLARELAYVIVAQISNNTISVDHIFNEMITAGPEWIDSWVLQPLQTNTALEQYLQYHVRGMAWQNDVEIGVPAEADAALTRIKPQALEKALQLGVADLDISEFRLNALRVEEQRGISVLFEEIAISRNLAKSSTSEEFFQAVVPLSSSIEGPLAVVLIKHLGDLCADSDAWEKAFVLYEEASARISLVLDPAWQDFVSSLQAIVTQSLATAIWTMKGAGEASELLSTELDGARITQNALLLVNASHDALVARFSSHDRFETRPDHRVALLSPPLLQTTHDNSSALQSWVEGDFRESHRRFWAILRRQTALGFATASRHTKSLYARSILDSLIANAERDSQAEEFQMAIRLLLESANAKSAARVLWNEQLIDLYVDANCVNFVIAHASKHPGSYTERQFVAVELFQKWAELASLERMGVAETMLKHVAVLALTANASFFAADNLGGQSLEALTHVAQKRPELRKGVASEVAEAVLQKLSTPVFWKARESAFETAKVYGDVFSQSHLKAIIRAALTILAGTDPAAEAWPIVRPALTFLVSSSVKHVSQSEGELAQEIINTVLRFGTQQTEQARVLFYLHDFSPGLLRDESVANKLREPLIQVRNAALQSNSSNATENIQALLIAPAIAGPEGVRDAVDGLIRILESIDNRQPSIAFSSAYQPLLILATQQDKIAEDSSLSQDEFRSWLEPIVPLITRMWAQSKDRPLLFAQFSLPPATLPNPVIVHNWAYASIVFAESLQQGSSMLNALDIARTEPMLSDAIAKARALRAGIEISVNPAGIRMENRETFYSVLGLRLAAVQKGDEEQGRELCKALIDQCFRLGPRDLDAAVLLLALRLDLGTYASQVERSDYIKRLEHSRDLRLNLTPLLEVLGVNLRQQN